MVLGAKHVDTRTFHVVHMRKAGPSVHLSVVVPILRSTTIFRNEDTINSR
jgi:hypothetical protein